MRTVPCRPATLRDFR